MKTMVPVLAPDIEPIANRAKSIAEVLDDVWHEVERAEAKHKPMNSAHEGYSVILEEFDELWAEVKKGGSTPRDPIAMRKEAVEVAAMAVRFIRDVCDGRKRPATQPPAGDT